MNVLESFKKINTFIFDVDGVLTDGTVLVLDNGLQARKMNIKDGFGLQMALKHGYRVLIVSGGYSPPVVERLEKLGISEIHMSIMDKQSFIAAYMNNNRIGKEEVLYMADDLPDLPAMAIVGMPCCPNDAVTEIREAVQYISPFKGGYGCARDVIEKVLRLHNKWHFTPDIPSR